MQIKLINLDKRPDRYNAFISQLNISTIIRNNYERISGIDGQLLSHDQIKPYVTEKGYKDIINAKNTLGLYLSKGAMGLALTYRELLKQPTNENILFLEDDIIVDPSFDNMLYHALDELPSDWDILYLGWYPSKNLKITKISNYINLLNGQINGTQAWLVNTNSKYKILDMFPLSYQIDTEIYRNNFLVKYSTAYPIVIKNTNYSSESDIQL